MTSTILPLLGNAAHWVDIVERAYVASGATPTPAAACEAPPTASPLRTKLALAASYAVAARFLAVGTPRTIGIICDDADLALLVLAALRVYFPTGNCRFAGHGIDAAQAQFGGERMALEDCLQADLVCLGQALPHAPKLRRGTHVNTPAAWAWDAGWLTATTSLARATADGPTQTTLAALAAGLEDGRQLDEISICVADSLACAERALAEAQLA